MFFPLRDDNPARSAPIVTNALLVANAAAFGYQLFGPWDPQALVQAFGLVPARFGAEAGGAFPAPWVTLFSSMFLHGDLFHLGGNLLYLWIFANNVEDVLGHGRFLLFYFISGLGAHALHAVTNVGSTLPTIGASGAISGVLAAYLLRFPHARVVTLLVLGFFVRTMVVPASIVIGAWFVVQLASGLASFGAVASGGGVAWFEHIGGFGAGLLAFVLLGGRRPR